MADTTARRGPPGPNRRRHERFQPSPCTISCTRIAGGLSRLLGRTSADLALALHDVAEGGIRLTVTERLAKGTRVRVRCTVPTFNDAIEASGTVVWETPHAYREGQFVVGVNFDALDAAIAGKLAAMRRYFTSAQFKQKQDTKIRKRPDLAAGKLEFTGE